MLGLFRYKHDVTSYEQAHYTKLKGEFNGKYFVHLRLFNHLFEVIVALLGLWQKFSQGELRIIWVAGFLGSIKFDPAYEGERNLGTYCSYFGTKIRSLGLMGYV